MIYFKKIITQLKYVWCILKIKYYTKIESYENLYYWQDCVGNFILYEKVGHIIVNSHNPGDPYSEPSSIEDRTYYTYNKLGSFKTYEELEKSIIKLGEKND